MQKILKVIFSSTMNHIYIIKYQQKYFRLQEFQETITRRPRMGGIATNHLAMLRERVERQRSVVVSQPSKSNSLEDLNCELKNDVENTRNSVDRLDNQISSLHQDVATLSIEVSNVDDCLLVSKKLLKLLSYEINKYKKQSKLSVHFYNHKNSFRMEYCLNFLRISKLILCNFILQIIV